MYYVSPMHYTGKRWFLIEVELFLVEVELFLVEVESYLVEVKFLVELSCWTEWLVSHLPSVASG
jgi:hypothetical protein